MAFLNSQDDVNLPDLMELNYQRYLIKVFVIVGLPILGIFMIHDFLTGRYLVAMVLFLIFSLITGLFFIINRPSYKVKKGLIFRYFFTIVFILFGFYLAYTIGVQGDLSRIPWAYLFPVLVFFALGAARALIWVSVLYCVLLILGQFFPSNEQLLIQDLKLRFYVSFIMVIVASFFFERLKNGYQLELMKNQQTLKESENRYREAFEQLDDEMKERQRAEENLRKSEERFREMTEHIREAFWLFLESKGYRRSRRTKGGTRKK